MKIVVGVKHVPDTETKIKIGADGCSIDETEEVVRSMGSELLSNLVFRRLNQAATWLTFVTSIPSLNFTPVMTLAR